MKKTGMIVQARMGSTRLPGKVLLPLAGKPMLEHVVERLKEVRNTVTIVATTILPEDDILLEFCQTRSIPIFRGDSQNVLSRYRETAAAFKLDTIVRVTSDCPLIEPRVIDEMLRIFDQEGYDYYANVFKRTFPRGLDAEIFTRDLLEAAWSGLQPADAAEHVVNSYIRRKAAALKIGDYVQPADHSMHRWTVDEKPDYELVSKIYQALYSPGKIFHFQDILELLERNPGWSGMNRHIVQKQV